MSVDKFAKPAFKMTLLALAVSQSHTLLAQPSEQQNTVQNVEEIIVRGEIGYRNRTNAIEQVLEYDRQYFERFEPSSAGDAMKRVPSVTFLSDVTESEGARLRGLSPGYTQILIDGERVPGVGDDRSFLLDRIPAEQIERVEVIRSSSAARPGDAVSGALNIVLRDSYALDGAYLKLGADSFDGEQLQENIAAVWGGEVGDGRLVIGANRQGRFNPKVKNSLRFGDSPENDPNFATDEFDNREFQTDVRDSTDMSFNADYTRPFNNGAEFSLNTFWVDTERAENERSFEYDDPIAITGPVNAGGNLETDNQQKQIIDENNYSIKTGLSFPWASGESQIKLVLASFDSLADNTESEIDFTDPLSVIEEERILTDINDRETTLEFSHEMALGASATVKFGAMILNKERDTSILETDDERDLPNLSWNQFSDLPLGILNTLTDFDPATGGVNTINEDRRDLFALISGVDTQFSWEAGVRYESTDVDIRDRTVAANQAAQSADYDFLLPSAHIRYELSENDRLNVSVARTVRRPNFNFMTPALLEEEVADNDLQGNPGLKPESAWGLDIGYERRLGVSGIIGVNWFYRDVADLIELTNTGLEGSEGAGTFVFTPENVGDGKVYGIEFDLSTPLTFLGMDDSGVFLNYSWLDSEVDDVFGKRTFNDQSGWVYNAGFIQDIPSLTAAFGITYREQEEAFGRVIGEEVSTDYSPDLELFVEKRWSSVTVRLVGSNLLDGSKDEIFNKFDSIDEQRARDFDEFELETEEAGPIIKLTARIAF